MDSMNLFIACLRCEMANMPITMDKSAVLEPTKLEMIYQIAKQHDMLHLLSDVVWKSETSVPTDIKNKLKKKQIAAVWRYEQMQREQTRIFSALEQAGVDYLPLKGDVVRACYPEPWMRTSCDIDVLVKREDLERAVVALTETLHYRNEGQHYHDVSLFSPGGVHLELHFRLNVHEACADELLEDVWDHVAPVEGHRYAMETEFLLFYFVAHMAGHFTRGGCGIRSVLDLWLMEQKLSVDNTVLRTYFEKAELLQFYAGVRKLGAVWFGGQTHDELTEAMEQYILTGGVYGSKDNRIAVTQNRSVGTAGYWKSRLFLSRDLLQGVYPELEQHPERYWFCQIKRWCRIFRKQTRSRIKQEFHREQTISGDHVASVGELLDQLNLREKNSGR